MSAFGWTHRRVQEALALRDVPAFAGTTFTGVSTDTRTLAGGELFVAITGDTFDGHDFVSDAVAAGAGWCLRRTSR